MAQTASEFLITQTQFTGAETYNATTAGTAENKIRLNLNHPVKALYWTIMKDSSEHVGPAFGLPFAWGEQIFSDPAQPVGQDLMTGGKLVLNGHDRFSPRKGSYFRLVEPYYAHVRIPRRHVYVYSFALKAGEHQPSGTCNFSRIDNAFFNIVLAPSPTTTPVPRTIAFYGKNYNVFRVRNLYHSYWYKLIIIFSRVFLKLITFRPLSAGDLRNGRPTYAGPKSCLPGQCPEKPVVLYE